MVKKQTPPWAVKAQGQQVRFDAFSDNGEHIGISGSTAYGTWRTSADGQESFAPDKGWNIHLKKFNRADPSYFRLSLEGSLNSGDITQTVNENNGGWNLVANPYPSVVDWDLVDDGLAAEVIASGYHVWDHENTN